VQATDNEKSGGQYADFSFSVAERRGHMVADDSRAQGVQQNRAYRPEQRQRYQKSRAAVFQKGGASHQLFSHRGKQKQKIFNRGEPQRGDRHIDYKIRRFVQMAVLIGGFLSYPDGGVFGEFFNERHGNDIRGDQRDVSGQAEKSKYIDQKNFD
jgi:hypothetical protein